MFHKIFKVHYNINSIGNYVVLVIADHIREVHKIVNANSLWAKDYWPYLTVGDEITIKEIKEEREQIWVSPRI